MAAAILEGRFQIDELLKTLRDSPESINAAYEATKGFKEQLGELRQSTLKALEPIGTQLLGALERLMPFLAGRIANMTVGQPKKNSPNSNNNDRVYPSMMRQFANPNGCDGTAQYRMNVPIERPGVVTSDQMVIGWTCQKCGYVEPISN